MIKQRPLSNPFDVSDNRAMVSLGPLSPKKYCTYSCPFCYVHTDFSSYASMSVPEIVAWLKDCKRAFDIIYVSGDTDSFAQPRTDLGLDLLEALCEFGLDLLFTTRAVFGPKHLNRLQQIQKHLASKNKYLFGAVSVAQLTFPHVEPRPIRPPGERLEQLRIFKTLELATFLAVRPFLPIVPISEYLEIVDRAKDFIDVVLGEVWYADKNGTLERGVFQGPTPTDVEFLERRMDFDDCDATWRVFEAKDVERRMKEHCDSLNLPFYMRSRPAIEWVRKHKILKPYP